MNKNINAIDDIRIPIKSAIVFPKYVSFVFLATLSCFWIFFTDSSTKYRSLIVSACYSLIESSFYAMTIELPNGDTIFKPFDPRCRKPHTTFAQFVGNVFYIPVGFYLFYNYISFWPLRIILFPLNIWALEIIEGYVIMMIYGYNVAWYYYSSDAMFHGNIRLNYWKHWILLGIFAELLYYNVLLNIFP